MSKGLILAVLSMLIPFTGYAAERDVARPGYAEYVADEMLDLLNFVADDAAYLAARAQRSGRHAEAKALGDLSSAASSVANKVLNSVVVPLRRGVANHLVKGYLQRLDSSFQLLASDAQVASRYSQRLARDVREVLYLKSDLQSELSVVDRGRPGRPIR